MEDRIQSSVILGGMRKSTATGVGCLVCNSLNLKFLKDAGPGNTSLDKSVAMVNAYSEQSTASVSLARQKMNPANRSPDSNPVGKR
jgi:hypothetical protein